MNLLHVFRCVGAGRRGPVRSRDREEVLRHEARRKGAPDAGAGAREVPSHHDGGGSDRGQVGRRIERRWLGGGGTVEG